LISVGEVGEILAMVMRRSFGMVMWVVVVVVVLGLSSCAVVESQAPCAGSDPAKLYVCLAAAKADVTPSAACCQALGSFNTDAGTACLCAASTDPRFTSSGGKSQFAVLIPQKCNLRYKAGLKCNGKRSTTYILSHRPLQVSLSFY
jgi:hypothetical protein